MSIIKYIIDRFRIIKKNDSESEQQNFENHFFSEYRKSVEANKNKSQDDLFLYL